MEESFLLAKIFLIPLTIATLITVLLVLSIPILVLFPFNSTAKLMALTIVIITYPYLGFLLFVVLIALEKRVLSRAVPDMPYSKNLNGSMPFFLKLNFVLTYILNVMILFWSPIIPYSKCWIYKLAGAKIGKNTTVYGILFDFDLIEIGNNCVIGNDAIISSHVFEPGKDIWARVKIGNNCLIGGYAVVGAGAILEDNVRIGINAMVPKFMKVKKGTTLINTMRKL